MKQNNASPSDDQHQSSRDLSLPRTGRAVSEIAAVRAELIHGHKMIEDSFVSGGRSGGTNDSSRPGHLKSSDDAESGHYRERGQKVLELVTNEFGEALAKIMNLPELQTLLDNPPSTMLWTPETDHLICKSSGNFVIRRRLPAQVRYGAAADDFGESRDPGKQIEDDCSDTRQRARRPELRPTLEQPGKLGAVSSENGKFDSHRLWTHRPKLRRTLENPAKLEDITANRLVVDSSRAESANSQSDRCGAREDSCSIARLLKLYGRSGPIENNRPSTKAQQSSPGFLPAGPGVVDQQPGALKAAWQTIASSLRQVVGRVLPGSGR